MINQIFF